MTIPDFTPLPEPPAKVLFERHESGPPTIGIEVLGGVALFEPNIPLTAYEKVVAAHLMIGDTVTKIGQRYSNISPTTIQGVVVPRLFESMAVEPAQRNRHALPYAALTTNPQFMHVEKRIPANQDIDFPENRIGIDHQIEFTKLLMLGFSRSYITERYLRGGYGLYALDKEIAARGLQRNNARTTAALALSNNPRLREIIDTAPRRDAVPLKAHTYYKPRKKPAS